MQNDWIRLALVILIPGYFAFQSLMIRAKPEFWAEHPETTIRDLAILVGLQSSCTVLIALIANASSNPEIPVLSDRSQFIHILFQSAGGTVLGWITWVLFIVFVPEPKDEDRHDE